MEKWRINKNIVRSKLASILPFFIGLIILSSPYGLELLPKTLTLTYFVLLWIILFQIPFKANINWNCFLLPSLFIIAVISLLYSSDLKSGIEIVERQINLLAIPILFYFSKKVKINITYQSILLILSISLLISHSYIFVAFELKNSIISVIEISSTPFQFVLLLRDKGFITINHPSYYSFLVIIQLILFFSRPNKQERKYRYLYLTTAILGIVMLVLLNSRAALLTLLFLCVYYLYLYFKRGENLKATAVLILLLVFSYSTIQYTRLGPTIKEIFNKENKLNKERDLRIRLWENATELIKQKPIIGYGIGDAHEVLIEKYKKNKFNLAVEKRFDSHNQFLETWLQSGLIGLISLLLIFAIPLYQSIKNRQEILFLFLTISLIQLLFESMFTRLAGIVYFSFFYSYLYYVYYAKGGEWEQEKQLTK